MSDAYKLSSLTWPVTPGQWKSVNAMFEDVYQRLRNTEGLEVIVDFATSDFAGPQGVPGPEGVEGPEGEMGLIGPVGPRGVAGVDGQRGPQGVPGIDADENGGWTLPIGGTVDDPLNLANVRVNNVFLGANTFRAYGAAAANATLFYDNTATTGITRVNIRDGAAQGATLTLRFLDSTGAEKGYVTGSGAASFNTSVQTAGLFDSAGRFALGYAAQGLFLGNTQQIRWSNAAGYNATVDTAIFRNGVGVLEINSGVNGTFKDLIVNNLRLGGATNPTSGTGGIVFPDGTAFATMAANTAGLYANDVAGTVRMFGIDEAGITGAIAMCAGPLTSTRVPFADANGLLTDDADMTFVTDTLTVAKLAWTTLKNTGLHHSKACTYISGTGTAGADNTAQTVKSVTLPADSLTQVGDRLRVRVYWTGDTGANITGTTKLGPASTEVTIATTTDVGAASLQVNEAWLHYIDNTHANIIENEAGAIGAVSAVNVAGFTWNAAQNVLIAQDAAVANHVIVYALIIDVFPKGIY